MILVRTAVENTYLASAQTVPLTAEPHCRIDNRLAGIDGRISSIEGRVANLASAAQLL